MTNQNAASDTHYHVAWNMEHNEETADVNVNPTHIHDFYAAVSLALSIVQIEADTFNAFEANGPDGYLYPRSEYKFTDANERKNAPAGTILFEAQVNYPDGKTDKAAVISCGGRVLDAQGQEVSLESLPPGLQAIINAIMGSGGDGEIIFVGVPDDFPFLPDAGDAGNDRPTPSSSSTLLRPGNDFLERLMAAPAVEVRNTGESVTQDPGVDGDQPEPEAGIDQYKWEAA